ncbi:aldose 1-epimerase family protein [Flavobacterium sp. SM2513]|uniref:aldose 1-epimerase family protein n=1 Tax=Flavobacterium sp. SM2513 TaxID=3424766 RepID=UPI003D7F2287
MKFQIKNQFLEATFDSLGAELVSLKSNDKEYIWEGNSEFWDKQSPILFPTIGSLKDDTYFFEEKVYHLPRHGFAREKEFQVVEKSNDSIVLSLKNDSETLKVYPFQFELQIEYRLVENSLEVHYKVQNHSEDKMYFSIGGHPGFALSEHFEDYSLFFETDDVPNYSLLENHLLADETNNLETKENHLPLNYTLFENDALVFKNHKVQSVTIQKKGINFVKVKFENFPDLGIWTKVNARFICIEPWFGHADEVKTNQKLEEKAGIQTLEEHEIFTSVFTIEIF